MRPSQSSGAATSPATRTRLCRCRKAETLRATVGSGAWSLGVAEATSALDLGPSVGPVVVVRARQVGAAVEAVGDRRGPVPDLLGVVRVGDVVGIAEPGARVVTGLRVRRR